MRAKVRLLRHHGVRLGPDAIPPWREGTLETEGHTVGKKTIRRLVLRELRSTPGFGVIAALHQPFVTEIDADTIRLRGLEEVELEDGTVAAVLQEWLVSLR